MFCAAMLFAVGAPLAAGAQQHPPTEAPVGHGDHKQPAGARTAPHGDHTHPAGTEAHGHGEHADPHAARGGHGDAHGGHGHGPSPINWFSLDYVGSKLRGLFYAKNKPPKWANPPLGFAILNFSLLLVILVWLARKPISTYLRERAARVSADLDEAAELRDKARDKLGQIDAKLDAMDDEIAQIKESVARDAEAEKERIIAAANKEAESIVASASRTIDQEVARAKRRLEVAAIEAAMESAEKLLRKNVTAADRERLRKDYYEEISRSRNGN